MDKFNYLKEQLTAALATWQQTNGGKTTVGWMHAANPEVIAALLAELERYKQYAEERDAENESLALTVGRLRVELEAKDTRIVSLERINQAQDDHINQQQDRIDSLEKTNAGLGRRLGDAEKRLATPVRLPDALIPAVHASGEPFMRPEPFGFYLNRDDVIKKLRAAGFTVEGG